jgi:hypothetical protein
VESPLGFTAPLLSHRRRLRIDGRPRLVTHMAVPRVATREIVPAGFALTELAGGVDLDHTGLLSTPYYHYVATKAA